MMNDEEWFAPKRFGYRAGLLIAWQGWAVLGGLIVVLTLAGLILLPHHPITWGVIVAVLTVGVSMIASHHTRGGWRWRWGGDT